MIELFCYVLSLKINLSKNCFLGINYPEDKVIALEILLGCKVGTCPLKCLGLSLGGNPRDVEF